MYIVEDVVFLVHHDRVKYICEQVGWLLTKLLLDVFNHHRVYSNDGGFSNHHQSSSHKGEVGPLGPKMHPPTEYLSAMSIIYHVYKFIINKALLTHRMNQPHELSPHH